MNTTTQTNETVVCEFCERPAKYAQVVNQIVYDAGGVSNKEYNVARCAYHKSSSRRHYEVAYDGFQRMTQAELTEATEVEG